MHNIKLDHNNNNNNNSIPTVLAITISFGSLVKFDYHFDKYRFRRKKNFEPRIKLKKKTNKIKKKVKKENTKCECVLI